MRMAGAGVKATFDVNAGIGPIVGSVVGGNAQVVAAVEILLKDGKGGLKAEDFELEDEEGGEKKKAAAKGKTGPVDEGETEPDKGGELF